jgi:hypothetical protein
MTKGLPNQRMAEKAYFERALKRRSIAGETNRPMAYEDINEKVRDKNFNILVNPHGTLNLDKIDNNQFRVVKGPAGIYINEKVQSKHNQSSNATASAMAIVETENPDLHPNSKYSSSVMDIAQGMRLALGISEPTPTHLDRKATRQLTRIVGLNRPVANTRWSKTEIEKYGVYSF